MAELKSLGDEPKTLREYETIYIARPDTANDKLAQLNERIKGILEGQGCTVLKVDNWGKRRLAYEIKKELKGIYLFWSYLGPAPAVAEVERNLRMLDTVIRYYTVKVGNNVPTEEKAVEMTPESFAKAAETAADEEEIMLGVGLRPEFMDDDDDGDDFDATEKVIDTTSSGESN